MSHEEHKMGTKEKLVYMANQIATFFLSQELRGFGRLYLTQGED